MIDVASVRADTPGCTHVAHLNNAGCALPARPVSEAVALHLELEARIGGYEAEEAAAERIAATYEAIARMLGCSPDEVALVESATRAWDMAFYGLTLGPGDRVLTGRSEYASNAIALLQVARRTGARVEVVPDDRHGQIALDALESMIDDRVRLIALTHVPTSGGLVNPAEAVGAIARRHAIPYLLDACQSAGQMPLDVAEIGCDMLSATGRKFLRGPRGTGFLYVRRDMAARLEPPMLDLRSATWTGPDSYDIQPGARRFETFEGHVAGRIGLGVAVEYAMALGLRAIHDRVRNLAEHLRERLSNVAGVTVHDRGEERCGIVTFTLAAESPEATKARLAASRVNVSVSSAHFAQFDLGSRGLASVVRASPHYYNTETEIAGLLHALGAL